MRAAGLRMTTGHTTATWDLPSPGTGSLTLVYQSDDFSSGTADAGEYFQLAFDGVMAPAYTTYNTGCSPVGAELDYCYVSVPVTAGTLISFHTISASSYGTDHMNLLRAFFTPAACPSPFNVSNIHDGSAATAHHTAGSDIGYFRTPFITLTLASPLALSAVLLYAGQPPAAAIAPAAWFGTFLSLD